MHPNKAGSGLGLDSIKPSSSTCYKNIYFYTNNPTNRISSRAAAVNTRLTGPGRSREIPRGGQAAWAGSGAAPCAGSWSGASFSCTQGSARASWTRSTSSTRRCALSATQEQTGERAKKTGIERATKSIKNTASMSRVSRPGRALQPRPSARARAAHTRQASKGR